MVAYSWGGAPNTYQETGYAGDSIYTPGIPCPGGVLASSGFRPIRIRSLSSPIIGGAGTVRLEHITGWIDGPDGYLPNAGNGDLTFTFRAIHSSGTMRVARNGAAGGATYWARDGDSRAGMMPGSFDYTTAPSAPTIGTIAQTSPVTAALTWSTPASNGGDPLTAYRIQWSPAADFSGATTIDVAATTPAGAPVTSYEITGLTPGQLVYFRVAAINAVTAVWNWSSVYSGSLSIVLIAEIGDLDGWESFGTLPAALVPLVAGALRRGTVYPVAGKTGLLREIQSTGAGGPIASGALGIRRTMTGLTIGKTYQITGKAVSLRDTTPIGNLYRFAVTGGVTGSIATTTIPAAPVTIPSLTFTATATSHTIRIDLAESASYTNGAWWEAVGFYDVILYELPDPTPYRLADVALESSLANHFAIACATVGAAWWVGADNVTRFRQASDTGPLRATFTDRRQLGAIEYVDVAAAYDTRALLNDLTVTNHGRDATSGNTDDTTVAAADPASIAAFGVRAGRAAWSMRTGYIDAHNLVPNPRAAIDLTGWTTTSAGGGTRQTTGGPPGIPTFMRQVVSNNGYGPGGNATQAVTVTATTYTAGVWVRSSVTATVRLVLDLRDGASTVHTASGASTVLTAGVWTRLNVSLPVTTPGSINTAGVNVTGLTLLGAGQSLDVTGFTLGPSPTDLGYFAGDTVDPLDVYRYAFLGTPHGSPTVRRNYSTIRTRIAELLAERGTPTTRISSVRFNAQSDPALASSLEIQDRIRVERGPVVQDSRIVAIRHTITPARWMVTLDLIPS